MAGGWWPLTNTRLLCPEGSGAVCEQAAERTVSANRMVMPLRLPRVTSAQPHSSAAAQPEAAGSIVCVAARGLAATQR